MTSNNILAHFFESYFHQDWRDDYSSSFHAVKEFCSNEPENKAKLCEALSDILERGDFSENLVNELGGNFKPEREGLTAEQWLKQVVVLLEGKEEKGDALNPP